MHGRSNKSDLKVSALQASVPGLVSIALKHFKDEEHQKRQLASHYTRVGVFQSDIEEPNCRPDCDFRLTSSNCGKNV